MGRPGRIPLYGSDPPMRNVDQPRSRAFPPSFPSLPSFPSFATGPAFDAVEEGLECPDCGWAVHQGNLQPGWTAPNALQAHRERSCGLPDAWPPFP